MRKIPQRLHTQLWIYCLLVVAIVVLGVWIEFIDQGGRRTVFSGQPSRGTQVTESFQAYGWPEKGVVKDETFRFWVTLSNHTKGPLQVLRFVDFSIPGFQRVVDCWDANVPVCVVGQSEKLQLPLELPAGKSTTVWAELRPAVNSGRYTIVGTVTWVDDSGREWQQGVAIGPLEVTTWSGNYWFILGKSIYESSKVLGLPIVLLLLGWLFQRWTRELASIRKEEEIQRTQIQETWNLMLPLSHQYASEHYIPTVEKALYLEVEYKKFRENKQGDPRFFFYYLLVFFRQQKELGDKVGGIFFKDREAESLLTLCWFLIRERTIGRLNRTELLQLVDQVDLHETFVDFQSRLKKREFRKLKSAFESWLNDREDFEQYLKLIEIFRTVLEYEANRPYELWYPKPERIDSNRLKTLIDTLAGEATPKILEFENQIAVLKKGLKRTYLSCGTDEQMISSSEGETAE